MKLNLNTVALLATGLIAGIADAMPKAAKKTTTQNKNIPSDKCESMAKSFAIVPDSGIKYENGTLTCDGFSACFAAHSAMDSICPEIPIINITQTSTTATTLPTPTQATSGNTAIATSATIPTPTSNPNPVSTSSNTSPTQTVYITKDKQNSASNSNRSFSPFLAVGAGIVGSFAFFQ